MPLPKWSVEPIFLCRNSAPKPELQLSCKGLELETVVNSSLVKCLHQLASIVKIADRIFEDVGSECRVVYERIERLRIKIQNCEEAASQLNARSVRVPVCDLSTSFKFLRSHKPYKTVYDQRTQLFLPSNRPPCIDKLYGDAAPTPLSVICAVDDYRTDGYSSSDLFMVTPVLGGDATKRKRRRKMMLDIETRKPANFSLARRKQDDQKSGGENAGDVPSTPVDGLERLPSPEERIMAMSMEYPSSLVPVDVSGSSFLRMSQCRRSLIHADFVIRRKKGKGKRRHTVCEGSSKELEKALENVTMVSSSCQTDDLVLPETTSTFFRRSFSRRRARSIDLARRETVALDGLNLDFGKKDSNEQAAQQDSGTTKRNVQTAAKKQGRLSLMSRAANPIISLSSVLSNAVRLRHSKSSGAKQDDGRSSSGNWSASSSARASVDSDHHHAALAIDRNSNLSRSSAGKDSLLSDGTQQESVRSQDNTPATGQVPTLEALSDKARALRNAHPWDYDRDRGRESSTSTPERSSDCASTPLVISPYICRRNRFNFYGGGSLDDGESSVYSVDTDGYYTSMHTDSGLWNAMGPSVKAGEVLDGIRMRHRRESQSSISTIGNGSVNSILSRTVTENSSETGSLKTQRFAPEPPPRTCTASDSKSQLPAGVTPVETCKAVTDVSENGFSKDNSPMRNGSASESDHEVGDRIRYKTTINSSRYPSMCAVSPETSDDELCELREKSKSPTVSVVVAEVHQVDDFSNQKRTEPSRYRRSPSQESESGNRKRFINMYGGHSPSESLFNSSLTDARQTATSTPKKKPSVTSFSPDSASSADTVVSVSPIKQQDSSPQPQITPRSPLLKPREMTAVPIPSVPRITPMKSPSPCPTPASEPFPASKQADVGKTGSTAGTPPTRPKGFLKNPFRQSAETAGSKSTKSSPPSYVSFQSPDSPVSSSTALSPILVPTVPDTAPAPNVDPVSRIAYASCSLDRNWRHNTGARGISSSPAAIYATLPKYHSSRDRTKSSSPVSDICLVNRNSPGSQTVAKILSDGQENCQPECTAQRPEHARTQNLLFRPSRGGRFCRTYFPSHLISPRLLPNPLASTTSPPSPSTSVKSESSVSSLSSCNSKTFQEADIGLPPVSGSYPQPPKVTGRIFPSVYSSPSPAFLRGNNSSNSAIRQSPVQFTSSPAVPEKRNVQYSGNHSSSESSASSVYRVPSVYKFRPMAQKYPTPTSYASGRQQPMLSVSTPTTSHILSHVAREELERNSSDRRVSPRLKEASRDWFRKKPTEFTPPNPPDVIPSSSTPPSTLDITSRTSSRASSSPENQRSNTPVYDQQRLKSLSSSELFAVIHSSKKKHNIKTESEKSLSPLSSRSSSPSVSCTGSPAKSPRVETGFLRQSPKLQDRSCSPSSPSGGLAADRFGRAKPTSMHDFKMLLLQTRVGSQSCSSRPSAAELLKVSPPKSSSTTTTLPQSTNSRVASSLPLSPKTLRLPSPHSNTASSSPVHVPVPIKRGLRTRSPYLTRYDSAYPPIWEDCSEDIEEADENQNTVNSYSPSVKELSSNRYCSPAVSAVLDNERQNRASTWV